MSLRSYIIIMLIATIACFLAVLAVINFFDPYTGGLFVQSLFYLSLFLALVGSFALIGLVVRLIFINDKLVFKKVIASFRQGIWLSLLACLCLYLSKLKMLDWKYLILLVLGLALLELFFISYKSKPSLKI